MHTEDVPVVVVGAGPAGLAAAIALARLGVETLLVERRAELSSLPRATAVSLRSMELIRSWGVEDAVRAEGVDVEWHGWLSETLATVAAGSMWPTGIPTREQAALLSPTAPACVPQDHLEPALLEHLRSLGAIAFTSTPRWCRSRTGPKASRSACATWRTATCAPSVPATSSPPTARAAGYGERSASPCAGPTGSATSSRRSSARPCGRPSVSTATASTRSATRTVPAPSCPPGAATAGTTGRGSTRTTSTLHAGAVRPADPRRGRRRRPRRLDRTHRLLQLRRPARRSLPRRQRVPRRRLSPPGHPARRYRDEHGDRQRARPGLEARLGAARVGRTRAAGYLRGRAAAGRCAQRRPLRRSRRLHARRPPTSCTSTSAGASRMCGFASATGGCPRWTS